MNVETGDPALVDGPEDADWTLLLAHGAGAGMDTDWMNDMTHALVGQGLRVVRFEFPYMQRRRREGGRRPPDRMPVLEAAFRDRFAATKPGPSGLAIGGKSMGGRVASHLADELGADALVCFGYPFHPPGKPERLRTAHLATLATPALIVQGERDPFGDREAVRGFGLKRSIRVTWMPDGDHGFKPRKRSGRTLDDNLNAAARETASFLNEVADSPN